MSQDLDAFQQAEQSRARASSVVHSERDYPASSDYARDGGSVGNRRSGVADPTAGFEGGGSAGPGNQPPSGGGYGLMRDRPAAALLKGRGPIPVDTRKYKFDVLRGKGENLPFEVSRDDRMGASEAGGALASIHAIFGVERENEGVLYAFNRALWFCHTLNSGSTLVPGRSSFGVPGYTQDFDYGVVRDKLGVNMRRFFRAFADDITDVNRQVLRDYDPYDLSSAEKWGWLMQVAHDRGMHRYPWLAHDSAEAGINLTTPERAALAVSKVSVISSVANSADRLLANSRVESVDKYNSTTRESGR